jgi:hypothetical protein
VQIFVKTLSGKTITLEVDWSSRLPRSTTSLQRQGQDPGQGGVEGIPPDQLNSSSQPIKAPVGALSSKFECGALDTVGQALESSSLRFKPLQRLTQGLSDDAATALRHHLMVR